MISAELRQHGDLSGFATGVIRAAGQLLLKCFGEVSSVRKDRFDLVTTADIAVERFTVEQIQRRFPGHQIVAEENIGLDGGQIEEFCWVIDPLDGTVNFATKIPFFSVSLALLYEGDPILALVYDPVREELFEAQRGNGSFSNGERLVVASGDSSPIPVGGSSGFLQWVTQAGPPSPLLSLMRRFGKLRLLGSQALQLCYVAAGRLRATVSREARLWDDAAGALIVTEAGGKYTDLWGQPIFPLTSGSPRLAGGEMHSLAAGPATYEEIVAIMRQSENEAARTTERTS